MLVTVVGQMFQPEAASAPDLEAICRQLTRLHARIPMFATWRICELEQVTSEYIDVITALVGFESFDLLCASLIGAIPGIREQLRLAVETQHWWDFNRASIVLGWDIEALIEIIRRVMEA